MLRSYQAARLRDSLELLPLTLILKAQAKRSLTSQPAHLKETKSAASGTPKENAWRGLRKKLSRLRCLQLVRVWVIRTKRTMMMTMMTILLRALRSQMARRRRSPGNQTPSAD